MSNLVYIASIIAAFAWCVCYLFTDCTGYTHGILFLSFCGVLFSIKSSNGEEQNDISKQHKS